MHKGQGARIAGPVGVLAGLAVCSLFLLGCPEVQVTVPPQLRGIWEAEGELYKGRIMEIGREEIAFDSGVGEVSTHAVVGVFTERLEEETRFALDYVMDNGGEYRIHLTLDHDSGQIRWQGRQQVIWNREEPG